MRGKKTLFLCVYKFRKNVFFGVMEIALGTVASFLPQKSQRSHNLDLEFATLGLNPAVKIERTVCLKCFPL